MTARRGKQRQAFCMRLVLRDGQTTLYHRDGARDFVPRKIAFDAINLKWEESWLTSQQMGKSRRFCGTSVMRSNRLLSAAELGRMREPNRALALNGRCLSSRTCANHQSSEPNFRFIISAYGSPGATPRTHLERTGETVQARPVGIAVFTRQQPAGP